LLSDAIEYDRYPPLPRIQMFLSILAKLGPGVAPTGASLVPADGGCSRRFPLFRV